MGGRETGADGLETKYPWSEFSLWVEGMNLNGMYIEYSKVLNHGNRQVW